MATFPPRIDRTLISNFIKGYWENTSNHRFALQALMKRGNITTASSGSQLVWDVRGGRYSSAAYNLLEGIDVSMKNHYFQCNVPWAFLQVNDGITRDEMAMASGEWAMVRHEKEMLKNICKDFETRLNSDFLNVDGPGSTGNVLYGLPSFLGSSASSAGSRTATASDIYAGQSTVLSAIAVDGVESNAWTPSLINYTSTLFNGGSAATWAGQALKAITFAKDQVTFGSAAEDQPDVLVVDRTMFSDLKALITQSQRLVVTVKPGDTGPSGIGIPGAVEHDGLEVVFDVDQPASTGYMINFNKTYLELLPTMTASNPGPKLSGGNKPEYFEVLTEDDIRSNGIICRVNLRGQFRFSPKHCAKLYPYA